MSQAVSGPQVVPDLAERKVAKYDGQTIWVDNDPAYELGNYLGGGASGVVYEAVNLETKSHVALKILNPIGFKLLPAGSLQRCHVAVKGQPISAEVRAGKEKFTEEHVWWLVHPNTKQVVAAYEDSRYGLRELPLTACVQIWGSDPKVEGGVYCDDDVDSVRSEEGESKTIQVRGEHVAIPKVPRKFLKFVSTRLSIYREIQNMSKLGGHVNVLKLIEALELVQDTKTTIFLVLELASGGELFDRIKVDEGAEEETSRRYFRELLSGISYCHAKGVCHRDLKPENLLLADNDKEPLLKIADFGLSASLIDSASESSRDEKQQASPIPGVSMIKKLKSVVGSPHYVAPEILCVGDVGSAGYDGAKADAWSAGVILYAMLAGNLPFGKELLQCLRFEKLSKWAKSMRYKFNNAESKSRMATIEYPEWFFPKHFTITAKHLLASLLDPDPAYRLTISAALLHSWVRGTSAVPTVEDWGLLDLDTMNVSPVFESVSPVPPAEAAPAVNTDGFVDFPDEVTKSNKSEEGGEEPQDMKCNASDVSDMENNTPGCLSMENSTNNSFALTDTISLSKSNSSDLPSLPSLENALVAVAVPPATALAFSTLGTLHGSFPHSLGSSLGSAMEEGPATALSLLCGSLGEAEPVNAVEMLFGRGSEETFKRPPVPSAVIPATYKPTLPAPGASKSVVGYLASCESEEVVPHSPKRTPILCSPPVAQLMHRLPSSMESLDLSSKANDNGVFNVPNLVKVGSRGRVKSSGFDTDAAAEVPIFSDTVKRSTRFYTTVPASDILHSIASIIADDEYPLSKPFHHIRQKVTAYWSAYKLEVSRGGVLVCTVQVFLINAGLYMVEFVRGQFDVFQFKRFYETIREKVAETVKADYSLQLLAQTASVNTLSGTYQLV